MQCGSGTRGGCAVGRGAGMCTKRGRNRTGTIKKKGVPIWHMLRSRFIFFIYFFKVFFWVPPTLIDSGPYKE